MRWITGSMLACCLVVAGPALAMAQGEATSPTEEAPLILSVEGAGARLSVTRLRRALAAVLNRSVLRMTDEGADDATGTLHIAFRGPRSWVVRLDCGSAHDARTIEVRGPALETLVGVAVDLIRSASTAPHAAESTEAAVSGAASPPRHSAVLEPWTESGRIVIASEILDPFVGMPLSRVALAAVSELLDPFTAMGAAVHVARSPEVLDPWR
jgi:hypothetical protein